MTGRWRIAAVLSVVATLVGGLPAEAGQVWRQKNVYFGDMHWHSCLSQDGDDGVTLDGQYWSMLYDYGLDFSAQSEHAEGAEAGIHGCPPYLPDSGGLIDYSGAAIATAMKDAADAWYGTSHETAAGPISFVTFPGYEWAPDARCWQLSPINLDPFDSNAFNNTPGHINYFFDRTSGWNFGDDVWAPGNGDSDTCAIASLSPWLYYNGSKDWVDEILGQLIHQRDDPDRDYDLMIQYNHPAASLDKTGGSDHLAKWFDFEHNGGYCSVAEGGPACAQSQCEAVRRVYGVTSVEWYTRHEASLGSSLMHVGEGSGYVCRNAQGDPYVCDHDRWHFPDQYVSSRGLREGFALGFTGGSDSHGGSRTKPTGFPGARGAGYGSLTVVYADAPTREAIWDGLTNRRTYALSRFREIGPVHKGRVDFYTLNPLAFNTPRTEHGMGSHVEALRTGTSRNFTISAGAENGTTGVIPLELRLYRVGPSTPLTQTTLPNFWWLDDLPGDPGKLGELLGIFHNATGSTELTHTFENVIVHPGDAVFAVVPYSDSVWVDDYWMDEDTKLDEDGDGTVDWIDTDGDGVVDSPKTGYLHNNNNTWARTTPIFFDARQEQATTTSVCATVTFSGSGSLAPEDGPGGLDGDLGGDEAVLPVAIDGGYDVEWNRYRFTTFRDSQYVDLSFFTGSDDHDPGTLMGVRIDGRLVYSGRGSIDHAQDTLVTKKDIPFPLKRGIHTVELHSDDQEFARQNDPDFHCNDHDGVAAFLDALAFHDEPESPCSDHTPPTITCPAGISLECNTFGGVSAGDERIVEFLGSAVGVDVEEGHPDAPATITTNAPALFPVGTTTVTFTAEDDAGNTSTCTAAVVVADTTPPGLEAFALAPGQIGPPRHDLKTITVPTLVASDVCDAAPAIRCSVASDEVPNGLGDGDTAIDIVFNGEAIATQGTGERLLVTTDGQGSFALQLRAERSAAGQGRTYTVSCVSVDAEDNQGTERSATVFVPKCAAGRGRLTGVCVSQDKGISRGRAGTGVGVMPK